ncbi:MAG: hypothetical protein RL702_1401 [Pseudomonadota bacterium]|jgi:uncharacterized protein YodC (DUF2158 family)|nr:hypothetical protein [Novosphingobium sp.]HPB22194.1 hypothetical protein [Novosphingobium sp.]HPZ47685.1 hypothetical protein [Novosphingobium sp.]HQD98147.1 hypothetical protein [Novosphingobium sp.]HQQ07325.1 hypothetical protein [Novosphingobium sp.]
MWFRAFLDPPARAAPWVAYSSIAAMPVIAGRPGLLSLPALMVGVPLAVTGLALGLARMVWVINKTSLTDGGPALPDPGALNSGPMRTRWFNLYGYDRRLFLLLLALIVELGLLGGHDAPREAGLWLWCVGVYLVGAANYTRTSPSEPVRTGETPNA